MEGTHLSTVQGRKCIVAGLVFMVFLLPYLLSTSLEGLKIGYEYEYVW